jgi:dipeptidyl aminopeptidase/acylaminoacyl peptidase
MTAHSEVRFPVDDGVELGAWLYLPRSDAQRRPAITMAHGYAGVKEHGITRFAEAFANAGFVVLLHDHRTFGISGGEPPQDVDPWRQVADWRRASRRCPRVGRLWATEIGLPCIKRPRRLARV